MYCLNCFQQNKKLIESKYLKDLFYDEGPKNCIPKCPAEIVPWYHPHGVFHVYFIGSKDCSVLAQQGLPFFTENYGPKWTEYTTVVHEIAGHHVEVGLFGFVIISIYNSSSHTYGWKSSLFSYNSRARIGRTLWSMRV